MHHVQEPSEGLGERATWARRSRRVTARSNTPCTRRRENAVLAAKMPSSGSPMSTGISARSATRLGSSTRRLTWRPNTKRSRHRPARHLRRLPRELGGQLVVEREDHRLLAREVAIQQPDAHARASLAMSRSVVASYRARRSGAAPSRTGGRARQRPAPSGRPAGLVPRGLTFSVNMFININRARNTQVARRHRERLKEAAREDRDPRWLWTGGHHPRPSLSPGGTRWSS